jgi:hypothetical protein
MAELQKTKSLKIAYDKAIKEYSNLKDSRPKPTWSMNQKDRTSEEAINRLIKQSPIGSAKRQQYINDKNEYKTKLDAWQLKFDQEKRNLDTLKNAYQSSVKLDPLIKKQQDNKDTGVVDTKTDAEIKNLEEKVKAAPTAPTVKPDQAAPKGSLTLGPDGKPIAQPRTKLEKVADPDVIDEPILKTEEEAATVADTDVVVEPPAKSGKDKPGKDKEDKKTPPAELTIDQIIDQVAQNYGAIDSIFRTDPDLQALLRKAIGKDGVPATDDDLTVNQFTNELENTNWFKANAEALQKRGFYKRQFDDLLKGGADEDELLRTSEYGRGLVNAKQLIEDEAVKVGVVLPPEELDLIARDIYDFGNETKPAVIRQRIRAKISYKPGAVLSGKAGTNLAELRTVAAANGLDLEKNFGPSLQGWLQKLAQGESIETFKQIVRSSAKLGLPDKVASLLDQGVDLDTIYKPYKDIMASVLEINPETITVGDSVLRSAIGPDKEMSLFDFQKMLRKDDRWQYTNQAKQEVSDIGLRVLRDFGFQG